MRDLQDDLNPFFELAFGLDASEVQALAQDLGRLRASETGLSHPSHELLRAVQAKIASARLERQMIKSHEFSRSVQRRRPMVL